jgi:hypothetical protein
MKSWKRKKSVSMDEVEAEDAVSLPNKEVMSLLDVNANVDLGLDLAAPVDLAAAANLNVAAPIEASAAANVLSPDAQAVSEAQQHGSIDQGMTGVTADATAPQHATIAQDSSGSGTTTAGAPATGAAAPAATEPSAGGTDTTTPAAGATDASAPAAGGTDATAPAATDTGTAGAVGDAAGAAGSAVGDAAGTAGTTAGGVESLLSGGSLLDANVEIHANANLTAPIDGAVAANANVAAPIDAAVAANVGSAGAGAEALAPQEVDISQNLDNVTADATAEQTADVEQK